MSEVVVGGKKYSEEELAKGIAALQRQRDQSKKWREKAKDPAYAAKAKLSAARRRVEQTLLIAKAKKQGITVTKEEVEKALAAMQKAAPAKK